MKLLFSRTIVVLFMLLLAVFKSNAQTSVFSDPLKNSIEFDVSGLYPSQGVNKNELMVARDSTGLNPATTGTTMGPTTLLWEPVEWEYSNPSTSGEKFDLEANATFTHTQSGTQIHTQLFYQGYGSNMWTLRFTGTKTGEWTFTTSCSDPDLNGLSGSVNVLPNPGAAGFITKYNNGKTWGRLGVDRAFVPQYIMYKDPPILYNNGSMIDDDIVTWIDEHGFNGFHTIVLCRWFDLYKDSYDDFSTTNPVPDPRTFEALELLITKATSVGAAVHLWAWGDEQRKMTPIGFNGGKNGSVDQRLQRYICARLGPLPGWSMGYGFDLQEWVSSSDLQTWHNYMKSHLGWEHFLGGRSPDMTQIYSPPVGNQDCWFSAYQQHRPDYNMYVQAFEVLHPGMPSFMTDRFRVRDNVYPDKDYDLDMTRRGLWHSTMAGGVGNIWGYLIPDYPPEGGSYEYPNKHQILAYSLFWRERFKKDLVRDNNLTSGGAVCLRQSNFRYVFYKEDTSSIYMNLSGMDGSQPAVAVDAKSSYSEIDIGTRSPTSQTWTAPYSSDWAIAVGTFVEQDPPVIAEVAPDPDRATPAVEYTRQLTLIQGSPPVSWSVAQGPTGTQVDGNGLVNGWTPTTNDIGMLTTFEIDAANDYGADTESWQVRVESIADFDGDGDVDLEDFGHFQQCLSGAGMPYAEGCDDADLNSDDDVDQSDFSTFLQCLNGVNQPPGC